MILSAFNFETKFRLPLLAQSTWLENKSGTTTQDRTVFPIRDRRTAFDFVLGAILKW